MGISGKHVLKTFGEYKDIKVRCVSFATSLARFITYIGGMLFYAPESVPDADIRISVLGLQESYIQARPSSQRCGKKAIKLFLVRSWHPGYALWDAIANVDRSMPTATKVKERQSTVLAASAATLINPGIPLKAKL